MLDKDAEEKKQEFLKQYNYPADFEWITDSLGSWMALHEDYAIQVIYSGISQFWFWLIVRWNTNDSVLHFRDNGEPQGYRTADDAKYAALNAYYRHLMVCADSDVERSK